MIDLVEVSQEGTHEITEVPVGDAPEIIEVSTSRAGRAATITIGTVTTGSPGSDASVTNSGTAGEAVLDFTIPTGENVELRINGGYIQWKTAEAETWNNLIEIADITATIDIGTVVTGEPGTDVLVTNSGAGKDAVFNFAIPRGDSVELRIDSGYIQWKYTADEAWNNLYAISAITPTITVGTVTTGNAGTNVAVTNSGTGKDGTFNFTIPRGDDVQLRIDSGYLQWKNTTASIWTNIVQIADITATITVGTVTTGAAGTSVTFVNAGSGKDAIFNLSIPKGTTFTPSVSAEGVISFTNDGGLTNPSSVNITGPQGPQGAQGPQGNPAPNTIYQYSTDGTTWTTTATGAHWYRQSGDNGVTWSEAIAVSTNDYVDAKITQTITEDVTDKAPSEGAVFDALALKAPLASPALSGTPTTPTPASGTTTTQIVNAQFVDGEFSARLKDASATVKGVVKVGSNISVADGVISVPEATEAVKGVVELATTVEVLAGVDDERVITPATLTAKILGTVSQVGGVPTGAVIESGTNANGAYVRFADGTMICYLFVSINRQATIATGALFRSSPLTWTFPVSFLGNPIVSMTGGRGADDGKTFFLSQITISATATTFLLLTPVAILDQSTQDSFIAIGRWY